MPLRPIIAYIISRTKLVRKNSADGDRDAIIRAAVKKLEVASWTEIKKETGFTDGKLGRGLRPMVNSGEVLHDSAFYSLAKYEERLHRRAQEHMAKGRRSRSDGHVLSIASGLLFLATSYPKSFRKDELKPDLGYGRYALQHLKRGYSAIFTACTEMTKRDSDLKNAQRQFEQGVDLLIKRLVDGTERLKGRCEICHGEFSAEENTELDGMLSFFERRRIYSFG
jgi:hypothetical protein